MWFSLRTRYGRLFPETQSRRPCIFFAARAIFFIPPRPDYRVVFFMSDSHAAFFPPPLSHIGHNRRSCRTERNPFFTHFLFFFFCFIIVIVILFRFVAAETGRQLVGYPAARSCSARDVCQQSAATVKIGGTCPPRTNTVGVTQLPGPVRRRISTAAGPGKRGRAVRRTWRARIVPDRRRQRDPIPNQCWTRIVYYFFFI